MSGHSKWATIKHKKTIKDKKKSKLFSKLINNIKTSLKTDNSNKTHKIKNAIDKALNNNISKLTIKKIINKTELKETKPVFLFFKNTVNIILAIHTIDDMNIFSDIKYILSTHSFINISINDLNHIIIKLYNISITSNYNESIILDTLKAFKINNFLDSQISTINEDTTKINNILNTNNNTTELIPLIKYKNKITTSNKSKIDLICQKLLHKSYIKNIFTNIM